MADYYSENGGGGGESSSSISSLAASIFYLVIVASISFWVQSVVTEERLVPALNVISEYFNIPDDVAGATLIAAGASSPELLCTIISLFITHSSLGLGTVVGSEIFNQLIICAGSVYCSKVHSNDFENVAKYGERYLVLDKAMVIREVGFYALSIGLLYISLSEIVWDKNDETERINVSLWKAVLLFGGYVLYVIVCVYMENVIDLMSFIRQFIRFLFLLEEEPSEDNEKQKRVPEEVTISSSFELFQNDALHSFESAASLRSVRCKNFDRDELYQLPFIYNLTNEPAENLGVTCDDDIVITTSSGVKQDNGSLSKFRDGDNKGFISKSFKLVTPNHWADYPAEVNEVLELSDDGNTREICCYLWERSYFYSKTRARAQAFHLRWFTITSQRICSVPDRNSPAKHVIVYPLFDEIHVDENRLIIELVNPAKGKRKNFILIAPSRAIFDAVILSFDNYVTATSCFRDNGLIDLEVERDVSKRDKDADPHVELIECPKNASKLEIALWGMLFPLRLIMHHSLPDVRHLDHHGLPTASVWVAYLSTIMSLTWLLLGSYVMVVSLETLADIIGIPDAVMGVTLSAAGTSIPAYIASRIAAERGFGNQAVANVFGSNTFNICIGLGLPWIIFCLANDGSYTDLENEQILESILTMSGALLLFVFLMLKTGCVLLKWHADLFVLLYVLYVAYSIGQVFWSGRIQVEK